MAVLQRASKLLINVDTYSWQAMFKLRCIDTVFSRPYMQLLIGFNVAFPNSNRYENNTGYRFRVEVCITYILRYIFMETINRKPSNLFYLCEELVAKEVT